MCRYRGLIAHTNSLAGLMGIPRQGPYSAAKAAARTLIDAARVELAPSGIRFTSIHPGFVATDRVNADGLPKPFQVSTERGGTLRHPCSGKRTGAGLLPVADSRAGSHAECPARFGLRGTPPEPGLPVEARRNRLPPVGQPPERRWPVTPEIYGPVYLTRSSCGTPYGDRLCT
ncbi:SDR family NAD(P)-dependent oxidoreductase [Streptomyces sp. KR80]|uniref:SDR family NAD(P)-dependent oxidoreductase n=1 Tax=Streptomyces sp. KR80 TaxID=3457426 RepID=UPI003FCFC300